MNIQVQETKILKRAKPEPAQELASLTRELSHCCLDKEEQICRSFGLHSADGRVLTALLCDNLETSTAIAEQLGIGNSRVTPLIDRLCKRGLVVRSEIIEDRRVKRLKLTSDGQVVAKELQDFETALHKELLSHFPVADRKRLLSTLKQLKHAMDEVRHSINRQEDNSGG